VAVSRSDASLARYPILLWAKDRLALRLLVSFPYACSHA
jgi:hypothetical protein